MDNLGFILGLMRENYNELGFIPAASVDAQYIRQGRFLVHPKGYLLHGAPKAGGVLSVSQAVIEYDYRERGYGHDMVNQLIARAVIANCREIKVRCAGNLSSNLFWQSCGFQQVNTLSPMNTRHRDINVWMLPLWKRLF